MWLQSFLQATSRFKVVYQKFLFLDVLFDPRYWVWWVWNWWFWTSLCVRKQSDVRFYAITLSFKAILAQKVLYACITVVLHGVIGRIYTRPTPVTEYTRPTKIFYTRPSHHVSKKNKVFLYATITDISEKNVFLYATI